MGVPVKAGYGWFSVYAHATGAIKNKCWAFMMIDVRGMEDERHNNKTIIRDDYSCFQPESPFLSIIIVSLLLSSSVFERTSGEKGGEEERDKSTQLYRTGASTVQYD
jgi:hypothetical protein